MAPTQSVNDPYLPSLDMSILNHFVEILPYCFFCLFMRTVFCVTLLAPSIDAGAHKGRPSSFELRRGGDVSDICGHDFGLRAAACENCDWAAGAVSAWLLQAEFAARPDCCAVARRPVDPENSTQFGEQSLCGLAFFPNISHAARSSLIIRRTLWKAGIRYKRMNTIV